MADIPNRRKSCGACVKGKRRCDAKLPRCQRCAKKGIDCLYPGINSSISDTLIPELDFPWLDALLKAPEAWNGQLAEQSQRIRDTLAPDVEVLPLPDFLPYEGPTQTSLADPEMTFAVREFKTFPEKWVKEGKAPFIHPQLYASNMPRSLQDAYSACAIYSTKTEQNSTVAFTVIESKANELIRVTKTTNWTPLEVLAAVQSLLIFQIIRLFDGDIRQRTLAEAAEPVLEQWTQDLRDRTEKEVVTTTTNAASWRAWLFAESVRRTIAMSYTLKGMYTLVKNGYCTMGAAVTSLSFTAQRALWAASSMFEWSAAVRDNPPFWCQNMQFDSVLQEGKSWDVDDFGIVMMVMYKGRDRIDEWLQKGNVERNAVFNPDLFATMIETMPDEVHPDMLQYASTLP